MRQPYTPFSPTGRVKRMASKLDEAEKIYTEVVTIAAPQLQTEEGRRLVSHSEDEMRSAWRLVCTLSQVCSV